MFATFTSKTSSTRPRFVVTLRAAGYTPRFENAKRPAFYASAGPSGVSKHMSIKPMQLMAQQFHNFCSMRRFTEPAKAAYNKNVERLKSMPITKRASQAFNDMKKCNEPVPPKLRKRVFFLLPMGSYDNEIEALECDRRLINAMDETFNKQLPRTESFTDIKARIVKKKNELLGLLDHIDTWGNIAHADDEKTMDDAPVGISSVAAQTES